MIKAKQLNAVNKKWQKKCKCKLHKTATQAVFGNGNPNAEIVFIGEAPGKKEDSTGIPFVGSAGKFLNEMLGTIKLKRENIYITNIVKYRPPNNRDLIQRNHAAQRPLKRGRWSSNRAPTTEEKDDCRDWLHEELNLIKPKLIVFLGRHSMNDFFPDLKISEAHGKLITKKINGIKTTNFLPLYHPAAALYNGGMRETFKKDFKKIPAILKKLN